MSLHLLTNDTGCVWRHAFDEHTGEASPFRSGYVNVDCEDVIQQRAGAREDVAVAARAAPTPCGACGPRRRGASRSR